MSKTMIKNGHWWMGECLEMMQDIPDNSIDMILCDLPYGTTACKWDTIIPFEPLWEQYHRVSKERSAIVLTGSQPFTSYLIMSNIKNFKYEWIWKKTKAMNFQQAKNAPLKRHENICVFSRGVVGHKTQTTRRMNYNPQGLEECKLWVQRNKKQKDEHNHQRENGVIKGFYQEQTGYHDTILEYNSVYNSQHPTQKPVALFEYLVKTYTNEGDTVLDNCSGSGTTAIACENTNRKWICIEQDVTYSMNAIQRIEENET